jgi:phage baseplate assembly protein V
MTADLTEILRLLQNLIRIGTIAEVSGKTARVKLGPKLVTDWLKWTAQRAGDARTWWCPTVGEQVMVLSPGGDLTRGKIHASVYSAKFPAPENNPHIHTVHYSDGAFIQYDSKAHALTATLPKGSATINAIKVTLNTPETLCTGDLTVEKNLIVLETATVAGSSALNGGVNAKAGKAGGAAMKIEGSVEASVDVLAGKVSLAKHPHGGVQRGNDRSDGPL